MVITSTSSHPKIFYVEKDVIKVPPHSQVTTYIVYCPSSLEVEEGKIFFCSDKQAKWTYHLSGYGLPQTVPEVIILSARLNELLCESITFKNPLNKTLPFMIILETLEG